MAIEGVSGTGLEAQSSQTDAVKSLIRWESPHPLSIAGVVFYDGDPAGVAVLVAKPLEDPLRGMPLLLWSRFILQQDLVDNGGERVELRPRRRPAPPVPGRHRKR